MPHHSARDDQPNSPPVVLMSGNFWQRQFHSDLKSWDRSSIKWTSIHHHRRNGPSTTLAPLSRTRSLGTSCAKVHLGASLPGLGKSPRDWPARRLGRLKPGISLSDAQTESTFLQGSCALPIPKPNAAPPSPFVSGRDNLAALEPRVVGCRRFRYGCRCFAPAHRLRKRRKSPARPRRGTA